MTRYLKECGQAPLEGLPWREPEELKKLAARRMEQTDCDLETLARDFLSTCNRLHSPHYMGHQVPPPLPLAALFELIGSITNQATGVYEMGQLSSAVERAFAAKLGPYLGWQGQDHDAIVTHGGSAANLTAILAARNARLAGSWKQGVAAAAGSRRPANVCSAESHYSVARAAAIVGLGADQVLKAPVDGRRRLDPQRLEEVIDRSGLDVFCVVASSCTTSTGAFDPIEPIAELCGRRGYWLHVDAAHGGGLLLSERHRSLLRGIERADSVTWDAHKMMFVPALCTFLFYRDKRHSFEAFDQDAPYLFGKGGGPTVEFDSALRSLECTKRPIAMGLWAAWCLYGPELLGSLVDRTLALARELHGMLGAAPDFEPLHEPECNILCFRHLPAGLRDAPSEAVSEHQSRIRKRLLEDGRFYITATRLDGVMALRVSMMNPLTEAAHLEGLLRAIRAAAGEEA
jgi:L-2,4-diaminobutyrate decarboxylase